jgi:hypothetical protein
MKKQNVLLVIYFSAITFAFSACQKSLTENSQMQSQSVVSPTPDENLLIRKIDFKNFTYPTQLDNGSFTLTNGEEPFGQMKDIAFKLENIQYADLTNDREDEAIIHISIEYGGSDKSGQFYVYTVENNKPKILWHVVSGYGAEGELKRVYAENSKLIVELFGNNKFVQDTGFKFPNQEVIPKNRCCPTTFTKFTFKWNGDKFMLDEKPKLFGYDWKKEMNKNKY